MFFYVDVLVQVARVGVGMGEVLIGVLLGTKRGKMFYMSLGNVHLGLAFS